MMRKQILRVTALALVLVSTSAWSQQFPCDSAKLVVPWARGGSTDAIYRIIAASANNVGAAPRLQIVNVSGQGGAKGTKQVQRAKPDGCTLALLTRQLQTLFARAVRDPKVIEALAGHGTTVKYLNRKNYRNYLANTYAEWEDIAIGVGMYTP